MTSRLQRVAGTLAAQDQTSLTADHWDRASTVLDALEPKISRRTQLDALPLGTTVYAAARDGLSIYRRHCPESCWECVMLDGLPEVDSVQSSATLIQRHESVRIMWAPQ